MRKNKSVAKVLRLAEKAVSFWRPSWEPWDSGIGLGLVKIRLMGAKKGGRAANEEK